MTIIARLLQLSGISADAETTAARSYEQMDKASLLEELARLKGQRAITPTKSVAYSEIMRDMIAINERLSLLTEAKKDEEEDKEEDTAEADEADKTDKEESDKSDTDSDKDEDDKEDDSAKADCDDDKVEESVETPEQIAARIMSEEAATTPHESVTDVQDTPVSKQDATTDKTNKVRMPTKIKTVVNKRIAELKKSIERYDEKGYNDTSSKGQAINALQKVLDDVASGDVEGLKMAQVYFTTLSNVVTSFFPPQLVNWLANATHDSE